jgi:excisionase family DNA binding protein
MAISVKYEFPPELIEEVAERAAEILLERGKDDDHWMNVAEAAEYLRCPTSRIYALTSAGKIPHHHDGARLLFRKSELDAWVENGGARRA